jgi:hypothetical protein
LLVKLTRVLVALLVVAGMAPAVALAHRHATQSERAAILADVVKQDQLTPAQALCQVVTISTVNQRYGAATWPRRLSKSCRKVAANGVTIEHRTAAGWRFVTVGSSFRCPIRHVPAAVARDLGVCR